MSGPVPATRRVGPVAQAFAVLYALVAAGVVVAPAVAVRATGARAGIEGEYDIDLLLACSLVSVFVVLFTQLISDVGYAYLNPRIRVQ